MMKISKILYGFLFIAITSIVIVSCKDDDELYPQLGDDPKNIAEIAAETPDLASFSSAIFQGGLDSILRSTTTYDVFAPNNDAFGASTLPTPDDEYINALLNHIIITTTPDFTSTMATGYLLTMATGPDDLNLSFFTNTNGTLEFNGIAKPLEGQANIGATNGLVHIVDAVLLPPTVADHARANPDYASFVEAMELADFTDGLEGEGPFTVFAPSNVAFESFLTDVNGAFGWASLEDIPEDVLNEILSYHVVAGENMIAEGLDGKTPETVQGETIAITELAIDDATYVDANIDLIDVQGVNGIIHGIDKVLIPEEIFQNILSETLNLVGRCQDKGYTAFVEAIEKAGLTDFVSAEELTAFAPTNDAFDTFFVKIDNFDSLADFETDEELALLKSVVEYQLHAGALMESELVDGELESVQGDNFIVDLSGPKLVPSFEHASSALLSNTNVGATNGILHQISNVLVSDVDAAALGYPIPTGDSPVFALPVYYDSLEEGFSDWGGWGGTYDYSNTEQVSNGSAAIKLAYDGQWGSSQIGAGSIDVSGYSTFHFSLYGEAATTVQVTLCGCDDGVNVEVVPGEWTDFSIPIPAFGTLTMDEIRFKEVTNDGVGSQIIYIDDVGFDLLQAAPQFRLPVYSESIEPGFSDWGGWGGTYDYASTTQVSTGDFAIELAYDGQWGSSQIGAGNIDVSSFSTFHFSLYGDAATTVQVTLCGCDDGVNVDVVSGEWTDFAIPISSFGTLTMDEIRFKEVTNDGVGGQIIYIDDVGFDLLIPGAPIIYDLTVYSDILEAGFSDWGGWGGAYNFASTTQVSTGDNAIELAYDGQWGSSQIGAGSIDVSGYSTFNFSLYGDAATTVQVTLCGCDDGVNVEVVPGEWTNFSIPISSFGTLTMDEIRFKEATNDGVGGQIIYIDDIGFNN